MFDIKIKNVTLNKKELAGVFEFTQDLSSVLNGNMSHGFVGASEIIRDELIGSVKKEITDKYRKQLIDLINIEEIAERIRYELISSHVRK